MAQQPRDPRIEIEEQLRAIMPLAERIEIHEVRIARDGTTFGFAARFTDGGWLSVENASYTSEEHARWRRSILTPPSLS